MLSKEYGYVNMILLICDRYDDNSIKNMFNTVYLEDEKDKLSFNIVLFYDFCTYNKEQINDLTIKIYLLKTSDFDTKGTKNSEKKRLIKSRTICEYTISTKKEKKSTKSSSDKFSSFITGFGGSFIAELNNFDFAGFGDYEFVVLDSSTELKDYLDANNKNLPLAHRCIRVMPRDEEV